MMQPFVQNIPAWSSGYGKFSFSFHRRWLTWSQASFPNASLILFTASVILSSEVA